MLDTEIIFRSSLGHYRINYSVVASNYCYLVWQIIFFVVMPELILYCFAAPLKLEFA